MHSLPTVSSPNIASTCHQEGTTCRRTYIQAYMQTYIASTRHQGGGHGWEGIDIASICHQGGVLRHGWEGWRHSLNLPRVTLGGSDMPPRRMHARMHVCMCMYACAHVCACVCMRVHVWRCMVHATGSAADVPHVGMRLQTCMSVVGGSNRVATGGPATARGRLGMATIGPIREGGSTWRTQPMRAAGGQATVAGPGRWAVCHVKHYTTVSRQIVWFGSGFCWCRHKTAMGGRAHRL